jgi:hypothetical protein
MFPGFAFARPTDVADYRKAAGTVQSGQPSGDEGHRAHNQRRSLQGSARGISFFS